MNDKRNVYIVDFKNRRTNIGDEIVRLRDERFSMFISKVFESINAYDDHDNLIEVSEPCIVFLHLGNGGDCGNIRSMEFYEKKLKYNKIAVIAYTGGSKEQCPMPYGFQEFIGGEKWHCYLNNINGPADLNLAAFFKEWSGLQMDPPPLAALRLKSFNHLIALSILCQGYLAAHGKTESLKGWNDKLKNMLINDALKKTEDKDWWTETINIKEAEKELSDKGNGKVKALLNALKEEEIKWDDVTNHVIEANKALPKILQEKG